MLAHPRPHRQPPVGDRAHQVDSAPRAVILVASLDVGRTARRAQAAVDTLLIADIRNPRRKPVEIDTGCARGLAEPRGIRDFCRARNRHIRTVPPLACGVGNVHRLRTVAVQHLVSVGNAHPTG